ncbi:branched-chain amino acid transport system ATP-binding protein [Rhodovulum iodosum]|uniref:Branched-chain amino acid transport system ATP-binding protein n=1 Tax=Rhodovulum iodosum TaxID=68291 RepID=A0ABV3XWE1_9RHOB|nr:ABC transporter ATP-binding protein [Rhodovulum robiginosum]RSK35125.1 ABC transporter ATP-binding protein [Rhodovulum robiginosum]
MLEIDGIDVAYGPAQVLRGLSLTARPGEITCLLGRNGAGKTTTMKAIMGLLPLRAGSITLDGEDIGRLPAHEVPRRGIGYIPQGRRLFAELTVAQNLEIGLRARRRGDEVRARVLGLFPRLADRLGQRAETLSGGEQQMLATARALCLEPRVLLLDEPTEGLQPSMIALIREVVVELRRQGVAIVLVEQRIDAVLSAADRVVFIENGQSRAAVDAAELRDDPALLKRYLGV